MSWSLYFKFPFSGFVSLTIWKEYPLSSIHLVFLVAEKLKIPWLNLCLSLPNSVYWFRSNAQSWRRAILESADSQMGKFLTPVVRIWKKNYQYIHLRLWNIYLVHMLRLKFYSFSRKWPQSPSGVLYIAVHIKNLKVPDDFENVSKLPRAGRIHMPKIFEDLRG